jgi:putative SOS response-associated peptidase YedK
MTDNAPELAYIHDRSTVILDPTDWDTWLHAPLGDLYQFDRPYPADLMAIDATDAPWFRKNGVSVGPVLL